MAARRRAGFVASVRAAGALALVVACGRKSGLGGDGHRAPACSHAGLVAAVLAEGVPALVGARSRQVCPGGAGRRATACRHTGHVAAVHAAGVLALYAARGRKAHPGGAGHRAEASKRSCCERSCSNNKLRDRRRLREEPRPKEQVRPGRRTHEDRRYNTGSAKSNGHKKTCPVWNSMESSCCKRGCPKSAGRTGWLREHVEPHTEGLAREAGQRASACGGAEDQPELNDEPLPPEELREEHREP